MSSFEVLVASRKDWIEQVLKPWCQTAAKTELLKADVEWLDIAGKVPPEKTLWVWAWSRFPELVHESLGIEETSEVEVRLNDGRVIVGFPDSRLSVRGNLFIWGAETPGAPSGQMGPYSIDHVISVKKSKAEF